MKMLAHLLNMQLLRRVTVERRLLVYESNQWTFRHFGRISRLIDLIASDNKVSKIAFKSH